MIKNQNIWVRYGNRNPDAKVRLFCLPYAGASASIFNKWKNMFSNFVEVQPIQLPGRENRYKESYNTDVNTIVQNISEGIEPFLDKPLAIFGHSMGALIGYELSCELVRMYGKKPIAFFPSGCRCPQLMSDYKPDIHNLPDNEFLEAVKGYNGIDPEFFNSDEYKEYFIPILRNDFKTVETYFYKANPLLECPIRVYCGMNDGKVVKEQIIRWNEYTSADFSYAMFAGDHFFINEFTREICHDIEKYLINISEEANEFSIR